MRRVTCYTFLVLLLCLAASLSGSLAEEPYRAKYMQGHINRMPYEKSRMALMDEVFALAVSGGTTEGSGEMDTVSTPPTTTESGATTVTGASTLLLVSLALGLLNILLK